MKARTIKSQNKSVVTFEPNSRNPIAKHSRANMKEIVGRRTNASVLSFWVTDYKQEFQYHVII